MLKSGCTDLGVGVESGSTRVLERIKKGYTREEAIEGVQLMKRMGMNVTMNIIVGFPFETAADLQDTISLIEILGVQTNINTFTPYPNTELYDECLEIGLIQKGMDWTRFSQHSAYNNFIHAMDAATFEALRAKAVAGADAANAGNQKVLYRYLHHARRLAVQHDGNPVALARDVSARLVRRFVGSR
jgi:radical SAM superfamily enzyme YgiQ (UPF0313 family)